MSQSIVSKRTFLLYINRIKNRVIKEYNSDISILTLDKSMASHKSIEKSKEILKVLFKRYPHLFDSDKNLIVPIWSGIVGEIIKDLHIHPDHHQAIRNAIFYYQSWNGYLHQLSYSRVKYNLWKKEVEKTTAHERNKARELLIKRELWTPKMEAGFRGRQLHVDKEINSNNTN